MLAKINWWRLEGYFEEHQVKKIILSNDNNLNFSEGIFTGKEAQRIITTGQIETICGSIKA